MAIITGVDGRLYDSITGALVTDPSAFTAGLATTNNMIKPPTVSLSTPTSGMYQAMQLENNGVTDNADAQDYTGYDLGSGGDTGGTSDFWTMKGGGGLALGGVQTGVALLGTLDQMKTAKLQRNLLGQQYDTNAEKMQSWRDNKTAVNKAFGGGLAAQGQ